MTDEFSVGTARPKYDPNAYYCESQDAKGHYERKQVRFPPDVFHRLMALAADPSTPYRGYHDIVRDAVVHLLNHRADDLDMDPAVVRHVAEITATAALEMELIIADSRKKLLSVTQRVGELASHMPGPEKDRLVSLIRLSAVGTSDEAKDEMMDLAKRYER